MRACARIAWRQARRAPWRSTLVVAMVAFPISALVFATTMIATAVPTTEERATARMGSAEFVIENYDETFDPEALQRALPPGARVVTSRSTSSEEIVRGGRREWISIQEVRLDVPPFDAAFVLGQGRHARESGEAVMHPDLLPFFGTAIGGRIRVSGVDLTVTGTVTRIVSSRDPVVVAYPGTIPATAKSGASGWLIDVEPEAVERTRTVLAQTKGLHEAYYRNEAVAYAASDDERLAAVSFAGAALALGMTGLIAAAAFVVGIRRQLRALGLIAAVGGSSRHVRLVVLLGGSVLGLVGSLAGAALGLAGAAAAHPHVGRFFDASAGALSINSPALVAAVVLGVAAATGAAAVPARTATKVAPMDALAVRMPRPRRPGRLAWVGVVIFALGIPLSASGMSSANAGDVGSLTIGMGALVGGLLLSIPMMVTVLGKLARWFPTSWRMAARDAARSGRRTSAALGAATLALTAAVATASIAAGDAENTRRLRPIGEDQAIVYAQGARVIEDLEGAFPDATVAPIRFVVRATDRGAPDRESAPASVGTAFEQDGVAGLEFDGHLAIGDDALMRALDADNGAAALHDGRIVALGRDSTLDGIVHVHIDGATEPVEVRALEVDAPHSNNEMIPNYLVSEPGARAIGRRAGVRVCSASCTARSLLVRFPGAISGDELAQIRSVAQRHDAWVSALSDWLPSSIKLRNAALALSALLALLIVGVALALVGAEARRDRAIMVAVGAGPGARRRMAAATAFLLTFVAGLVAIPAGFTPYAVTQWSRPDGYPVVFPLEALVAMIAIVPAIAALAAFLGSRRPSAEALLRPIV